MTAQSSGTTTSPAFSRMSWGEIETDAGTFRDAKLWPGGGRGWDWNETGTEHSPGIQPADVEEVLDHDPEVVVLGRGQNGRLQVMDGTLEVIEERGAKAEMMRSDEAVQRYNELASDGRAVGALIHTTC